MRRVSHTETHTLTHFMAHNTKSTVIKVIVKSDTTTVVYNICINIYFQVKVSTTQGLIRVREQAKFR